ncbi:Transmembrane emp24 domain-containing protein 1 [Myotis brandtii]|uniref:Transmembrane emp24 domain-containing protein 1 n=2 Tax=Myotis TaxID=9434 RepID=S7MH77_MYOBR|nr:Transmembrane emp24 domain-containing protein 1 [Myotis brandtii]
MIKSGAWPDLADEVLPTGAGALPEERADPKAVISRGAEPRQWAWPEGLVGQDLVAGVGVIAQVIAGAGLDVDFTLESPQGVLLVSESRKADGVHTVEPTEAGDYKLCFDNSFSTISEKLVFFELIFDSLQDDEEVEGWAEVVEPEEMLDVKMEDIKESIETMRTRLERSIQMLTLLRALEARDRNLQEGNLERVTFWSAVNVAVLLLVAVLQVCTLKRFFQDKRPVPT